MFVRNIMPVRSWSSVTAISVVISFGPIQSLMVANLGCASVGSDGMPVGGGLEVSERLQPFNVAATRAKQIKRQNLCMSMTLSEAMLFFNLPDGQEYMKRIEDG